MPLSTFFRRLLLLYITFIVTEMISMGSTVAWLPESLRQFEENRMAATQWNPEMISFSPGCANVK